MQMGPPGTPPPPQLHPDKPSFSCTVKTVTTFDNNSAACHSGFFEALRRGEAQAERTQERPSGTTPSWPEGVPVRSLHPFT